jgi:hypothetical protein
MQYQRPSVHQPQRKQGVALVLTLLIVAMLVVVVVGFTTAARTEQTAARNATYRAHSEQLAQEATARGMQKLASAFGGATAGEVFATQPGRITRFGAAAIDLFSSGGNGIDLNSLSTNGWITGRASDAISAGAEPVVDVSGKTNGRIFFFIDDESTKLPINLALGERPTLNPALPRPYSFKGLRSASTITADNFDLILDRLNFVATNTASLTNSFVGNWSYFFTPEQMLPALVYSNRTPQSAPPIFARNLAGAVQAARTMVQITTATQTNAALSLKTPWGTDKVLINELSRADASVTNLTEAMTDTRLTTIFGSHFGDKYGEEGVKQLAANMIQLRSDYWTQPMNFNGSDPVIGTEKLANATPAPAPTSGDLKKTNGIPQECCG